MIEEEFTSRDKELIAEQKKIKELEDKFKKDRAILSEQESSKLERDIISKKRDLKRKQDEFREDLTYRRNEEMGKIQKQIIQIINLKFVNYHVNIYFTGIVYVHIFFEVKILNVQCVEKKLQNIMVQIILNSHMMVLSQLWMI